MCSSRCIIYRYSEDGLRAILEERINVIFKSKKDEILNEAYGVKTNTAYKGIKDRDNENIFITVKYDGCEIYEIMQVKWSFPGGKYKLEITPDEKELTQNEMRDCIGYIYSMIKEMKNDINDKADKQYKDY